jgi:hypothetical protein
MTLNKELLTRAQQPGCSPLREMTDQARKDIVEALTAALVRPAALELADALEGEPLEKLRQEAAGPAEAVAAARDALRKEKESVSGRLAAFWQSKRRADPDDRESAPATDTPKVQELQAALNAAQQAATPSESKLRAFGYMIESLRAAPAPDPAVLAALAMALAGATTNGGSMETAQAPQTSALAGGRHDAD